MTKPPPRCAHCYLPMQGSASLNDNALCHPDEGPDCYRLVTIYGHPMPCANCPGQVAMRTFDQLLE